MQKQQAEEWTQSLGQIFTGGWRQIVLADDLGVPKALGLTLEQWVKQRIGGYVKLTIDERREAAKELKEQGKSQRQIADVLGVDEKTIRNDIAENSATEKKPEPNSKENLSDDAENSATEKSALTTRQLLSQSDQNDWRTPRKFLEAAHAVMGGIDLDPATSAEANETVKAERFYTEVDDGLKLPWKGRVWLNPPYGGNARLFVERLIKEYQVGNVTAACLLVNSHPTETKWFQELFNYTVCFIRGRIDFGGPSRAVSSCSTHGSAIIYLGRDVEQFREHFWDFGAVVKAL